MYKILLPGFFLLSHQLWPQSASSLLGARSAGLGFASATLQDEWSFFNNVAGIANVKERTVSSTFEIRPALPGANRMAALVALPFSFGTSAFGVFRFGDELYSEQIISTGFANQLGHTSLGAKLSYIQYRTQGFGTHGTWGINLGGITQLTPQISIGAWIQNINQPKLNFNEKEKAPVKLLAAFSFKPSEKFLFVSELEKDVLYRPIWKTGMEYNLHKKFFSRMGFNIHPSAFFFGVGFQSWRIKIDYALQSLTLLGASHQASASYRFSKSSDQKK